MSQEKKLVRLLTCGSVDNGKSTLIGRLMLDAKALHQDQIDAVRNSQHSNGELNLAMFTDGLTEERERGITIDVAYRYFTTSTHKFILADCPGHAEFTRNMATGASNSDIALILVDPNYVLEHGKLEDQTMLHFRICERFDLETIFVINKADTIGWDSEKIGVVSAAIDTFTRGTHGSIVPVSALTGENVTEPYEHAGVGSSHLMHTITRTAELIEGLDIYDPCRAVVQAAAGTTERACPAKLLGGILFNGSSVQVLPPGQRRSSIARITALSVLGRTVDSALPGDAIEIELSAEAGVLQEGTIITTSFDSLDCVQEGRAILIWMSDTHAIYDHPGRYVFRSHLRSSSVTIDSIQYLVDPYTGEEIYTENYMMGANDIGYVTLTFGDFIHVPKAGGAGGKFILYDTVTGDTVAAGYLF